MKTKEEIEVKTGLQFQLKEGADRTIFTIHSIFDQKAYVIWPNATRMQEYWLSDIKNKFLFGDWLPASQFQSPQKEEGSLYSSSSARSIEKGESPSEDREADLKDTVIKLTSIIEDQAKENERLKKLIGETYFKLGGDRFFPWQQFKSENNL